VTFTVGNVALISRASFHEPFRIRWEVPLGGGHNSSLTSEQASRNCRQVDVPYVATCGAALPGADTDLVRCIWWVPWACDQCNVPTPHGIVPWMLHTPLTFVEPFQQANASALGRHALHRLHAPSLLQATQYGIGAESPGSVWYFAYGANMSPGKLSGKRGIQPLQSRAAKLPGWRLTFDHRCVTVRGGVILHSAPERTVHSRNAFWTLWDMRLRSLFSGPAPVCQSVYVGCLPVQGRHGKHQAAGPW
jgi:hypothetical protein